MGSFAQARAVAVSGCSCWAGPASSGGEIATGAAPATVAEPGRVAIVEPPASTAVSLATIECPTSAAVSW